MRCIPADGFLPSVTATYDHGGIALLCDAWARDQPSLNVLNFLVPKKR
jgi:hypothetical protein